MFYENVILNDTGRMCGDKWAVWSGKEEQLVYWIYGHEYGVVRYYTLLHDFVNGLVNTLLNYQEVLKYMGEVMICRGGGGNGTGGGSHGSNKELVTLKFIENQNWTVPDDIVNNEVSVRLFGAGGGGGPGGGGSGWMNNDIVKVYPNTQIAVTIGRGGDGGNCKIGWNLNGDASRYLHPGYTFGTNGGPSSFGPYLFANGGCADVSLGTGTSGSGGSSGGWSRLGNESGEAYQFGSGGAYSNAGNAGVWGGGGAGGGNGGLYGGGGGGSGSNINAGNGGRYGGGGGLSIRDSYDPFISKHGLGGEFGGNGGNYLAGRLSGGNGTNTIGWNNVLTDDNGELLTGYGRGGTGAKENSYYFGAGGGGGFGGDGGSCTNNANVYYGYGGGGYGGNGGSCNTYTRGATGGGGFGGDGGCNTGGGGGFGKNARGGDNCGGGGGYNCAGHSGKYDYCGGGGGGIIVNGIEFASGGDGIQTNNDGTSWIRYNLTINGSSGLNGICLVQYYRWIK